MNPVLFIPVGIPGCGKSHFGRSLGADIVSTDAIRKVLTGSEDDQTRNADVFAQFHGMIHVKLINGRSVYADATNLRDFARERLLREVESARRIRPIKTHLILFRNVHQAIDRNGTRTRVVPSDIMIKMLGQYEKAVVDLAHETYDFVTEVSATR